ncbi:MAG TPA: hypothetical protein VKA74_03345, partial [Myxococcota bacterium]|nr:hypothetical protein [Myxococcota bacterium]
MFSMTDRRFAEDNAAELERQREIALGEGRRPFRNEDMAMRRVLPFEQRVEAEAADSDEAEESDS